VEIMHKHVELKLHISKIIKGIEKEAVKVRR